MNEKNPSGKTNGVDTEQLFENIERLKKQPDLANFKFHLKNKWINCGHNRSTITNFYGVGEEQSRKKPFVCDADEPPVLLGTDKGPNPVEYLLTALASCVTSAIVYHAAAKGVQLDEIESHVEGIIDLRGFMGIDDNVPRGYKEIRMKFKIKADVPEEKLKEILELGPTYSPVYDTITREVPVKVELEKA